LVVTAGAIVPLRWRPSRALSGCHRPPRQARTGRADSVTVNMPRGLTVVLEVGVVSAETVTRRPVRSASRAA
jgi:hypothetical protein